MFKFILIILDGFGLRKEKSENAIAQALTPTIDYMFSNCPNSSIETSGKYVGLPNGVMGNSEVGHMNIGAGRIVKQDLVKINDSIKSNELKKNDNLIKTFKHVEKKESTLHLIGLVSEGGVHSHLDHFKYILDISQDHNIKRIAIHVITDGRDSPPDSAENYVNQLELHIKNYKNCRIVSLCGRYYAMDRDNRWDRIEKAYRMYIHGEGSNYKNIKSAISSAYEHQITDEFILPTTIGAPVTINNDDAILMMNFRADRMRQIVSAINESSFAFFKTESRKIMCTCMTKYMENFPYKVLFKPEKIKNIFPEVLAKNHFRQLRIAETEKYAHVTYFFNGGEEKKIKGEFRYLVPSPKVDTYDLQPEMSAP